jgi:hypothetical protein
MLLSSDAAAEFAQRELAALSQAGDPVTGSWERASCGRPLLVRDLRKAPSYWLVPVISEDKVAGAIRVMGDGAVAAVERFRQPAGIVTGIDATEARRRAAERIVPGETLGEPVFIHDGPPGREAWLVEVLHDKRAVRWIFLNASGAFERPAGTLRSAEKE